MMHRFGDRSAVMLAVCALSSAAAPASKAASPPQSKAMTTPLVPLRENDVDAFARELPGENMGDGGEFSIGRKRYVRLEGRHLTFRTAAGVQRCVVAAAAAKAWTFDTAGTVGCAGVSLRIAVDPRSKSDSGQPVIVTVAQGKRVVRMAGLWQGLD